jgi:nucleotide-binding universal stress UspA family protein
MIQSCRKAIQVGVSLAQHYGASLYVFHSIYNLFGLKGWNLGTPSIEEEYKKDLLATKETLSKLVEVERKSGMEITEIVRETEPTADILKIINEEQIDLLVMLAHTEGHLEDLFFQRSNDELVRKMPCSIILVKKEPKRR